MTRLPLTGAVSALLLALGCAPGLNLVPLKATYLPSAGGGVESVWFHDDGAVVRCTHAGGGPACTRVLPLAAAPAVLARAEVVGPDGATDVLWLGDADGRVLRCAGAAGAPGACATVATFAAPPSALAAFAATDGEVPVEDSVWLVDEDRALTRCVAPPGASPSCAPVPRAR